MLLLSNPIIGGDALYVAINKTKGVVGTFRHDADLCRYEVPQTTGLLGYFVCTDMLRLKAVAYEKAAKRPPQLYDLTDDILVRYRAHVPMQTIEVDAVVEFGTETDLKKARELWEAL